MRHEEKSGASIKSFKQAWQSFGLQVRKIVSHLVQRGYVLYGLPTHLWKQIAAILSDKIDHATDERTKDIIRNLSAAFIGIIAESIQDANPLQMTVGKRHLEIMLKFHDLLATDIRNDRRPSHYASLLNISLIYLNEVVNSVTGMSVSRYIQNEIVLQAKRLLIHSNNTIQEIADGLGINDYAYFSKLFTKATGISPSLFRRRIFE